MNIKNSGRTEKKERKNGRTEKKREVGVKSKNKEGKKECWWQIHTEQRVRELQRLLG